MLDKKAILKALADGKTQLESLSQALCYSEFCGRRSEFAVCGTWQRRARARRQTRWCQEAAVRLDGRKRNSGWKRSLKEDLQSELGFVEGENESGG